METIWFLGIDWGTKEHRSCVIDAEGGVISEFGIQNNGDGLRDLLERLNKITDGRLATVRAAIEVPQGAVVDALMERNVNVFSINPKQLDRFRDRFTVAGAKDDRRDARVLADSLRTDERAFRYLTPTEPDVIRLREWCAIWRELSRERVRLVNRICAQLQRYFPQYLELGMGLDSGAFSALWALIPTPAHAQTVEEADVASILKENRIRRIDAAGVLDFLRRTPFKVAEGTCEAAVAHIEMLIERAALIRKQMQSADRKMEELCAAIGILEETEEPGPSSVSILRSSVGVGVFVLSTILSRGYRAVKQRDLRPLRALAGVAPVTITSGKSRVVVMRRACDTQLRDAMYHWTRTAIQRDPISKAKYADRRLKGDTHGRALRSVADRLLTVATAMLRDRTLYRVPRQSASAA